MVVFPIILLFAPWTNFRNYMHVCVCVCVCVWIMYICMYYVCMCVCVCVCSMCVCVYVCMYLHACTYVCMYLHTRMISHHMNSAYYLSEALIYLCVYVHLRAHNFVCTYDFWIHVFLCMYMCINVCKCVYLYVLVCVHWYICNVYLCMYTISYHVNSRYYLKILNTTVCTYICTCECMFAFCM